MKAILSDLHRHPVEGTLAAFGRPNPRDCLDPNISRENVLVVMRTLLTFPARGPNPLSRPWSEVSV